MKVDIEEITKEVCNNQNYDELLINIVNNKGKNKINELLEEIYKNSYIDKTQKIKIYETIFEYVDNVNEEIKRNLKQIFAAGVSAGISKVVKRKDRK